MSIVQTQFQHKKGDSYTGTLHAIKLQTTIVTGLKPIMTSAYRDYPMGINGLLDCKMFTCQLSTNDLVTDNTN